MTSGSGVLGFGLWFQAVGQFRVWSSGLRGFLVRHAGRRRASKRDAVVLVHHWTPLKNTTKILTPQCLRISVVYSADSSLQLTPKLQTQKAPKPRNPKP